MLGRLNSGIVSIRLTGPCGSFFEEALSQHNETNLEVELGIDPYTSLALAEAGISSGDLGSLDVYDIVERVWRQTYVKVTTFFGHFRRSSGAGQHICQYW